MKQTLVKRILPAMILLLAVASGRATELSRLFSENAVLQRDRSLPIWGTGRNGESITVTLGERSATTTVSDGKWRVELDALPAGGPLTLTVMGDDALTVTNVLMGEVWLCSGQSNMEWALGRSTGGPEAVMKADNPQLRLCTIPHNSQMTPTGDVAAKWEVSSAGTTRFFSAIAWWFGNKLQHELGVPVGIISNPYGGTGIECWMSRETLRKGPWPQDKHTDVALAKAQYDLIKAKLQPAMDKYLIDRAAATRSKTAPPPFPVGWPGEFRGPATLWNGMVTPLLPLSIRGVLWYQGESNAYPGVADTYAALLPALLADWRAGFAQPNLPFIIFQIAPNRKPQTDPNEDSGIAVLQEAQLKTALATPHTALVVTFDLGEPDVHYKNKEPAADRALKSALSLAYGRDLESSSPIFTSLEIGGGKATVHFSHATGGLIARDGPLTGFVIAGEDRKFVFADAQIEGDTVVVSSAHVAHPIAVRYAWADLPKANLFNGIQLPASPFRSDDWPFSAAKSSGP